MASLNNMQFWYVTVMEGFKIISSKKCLNTKQRDEEFAKKKAEYPTSRYCVMKERY